MFLGLFTDLFEVGGVQQLSRHAAAVLQQMARERGQRCWLASLNDARGIHSFSLGLEQYSFRGFGRRKGELLAYLARVAPKLRLVYLGHPHLAPVGLFLRLFNRRLPYWVAAHGVEVWTPLSLTRRLALRRARGITAVSAFTAERMAAAQGLDPHKVYALPPALDPGFANGNREAASLSLPPDARVILTVGRLISSEPGKGIDTVIRALPKVLRAVPKCLYVVVGDGDDRNRLEQLAAQHDVRNRVHFVGRQAVSGLKEYYLRSEVFIMPSRQEGFGIVFLEAMACGKPIIGGNHGGTPEIVEDGVTGFLVESGDVGSVADRLTRLLQDDMLRRQMGDAARRRVEGNYTFEQFRRRFIALLDEANGKPSR